MTHQRPLPARIWYFLVQRTLQLLGVIFYRLRCSGRENVPLSGGVLLAVNHQSHFDPPLIGTLCPRPVSFIARANLFRAPFLRDIIASLGAYPIDREGSGLDGIRETLKRLKRGETVCIFPEGTRTSDGEMASFRPGFATLAKRGHTVIVPVAIEGSFDAWPRSHRFPRFSTIHVHFGDPILPEDVAKFPGREVVVEVERRVHACLCTIRSDPAFASRNGQRAHPSSE